MQHLSSGHLMGPWLRLPVAQRLRIWGGGRLKLSFTSVQG